MIVCNKDEGTSTVVCDNCSDYEIFYLTDWHEVLAEAKVQGWKIAKDAEDKWVHYCPECAQDVK